MQSLRKGFFGRLAPMAFMPVFFFLAASGPGSPDPRPTLPDWPIEIVASPISQNLWGQTFGALKLRAILDLNSPDDRFGGWSGLMVEPDGALLALSDRAALLRARFVMDENQIPTGLENGVMGVLRDEGGDQAPRLRSDAEGLARLPNGMYVVSFETPARIGFYNFGAEGAHAPLRLGPALARTAKLNLHYQLESVTTLTNGDLLVGSERGFNGGDKAVLWRVPTSEAPSANPIEPWTKLKLPRDLSLTDLAAAPDGSVFALFRQFTPYIGARAQIWRYEFNEQDGKAHAKGQMLASLEAPFPVDNYEGLAVTSRPDGGLRLYVISDDNFRKRQRTLLLALDLDDEAKQKGAGNQRLLEIQTRKPETVTPPALQPAPPS